MWSSESPPSTTSPWHVSACGLPGPRLGTAGRGGHPGWTGGQGGGAGFESPWELACGWFWLPGAPRRATPDLSRGPLALASEGLAEGHSKWAGRHLELTAVWVWRQDESARGALGFREPLSPQEEPPEAWALWWFVGGSATQGAWGSLQSWKAWCFL